MNGERVIPYYFQVAETINGRIQEGRYGEGDLIPPDRELEKEFKVSNITIRKALELLVQNGIVERKRGVGTTVSRHEQEVVTFKMGGNFRGLLDSVEKFQLEVSFIEIAVIPCPNVVRRKLCLEPGEKVWRMKRVRKHKGMPVSYHIYYSRQGWCEKITKEQGERRIFVELFQEVSSIRLTRMEQRIEPAIANIDLSAILHVNFGAPLFFVENMYYSTGEQPVVITQTYYRGEKFSYSATAQI